MMNRTIQLRSAAIPFYKAVNPEPILTGKVAKVPAKDKRYVEIAERVKFGKWQFGVVQKDKTIEVKIMPQAPRNAVAIVGVSGSLDHHHHKSDIAKSNISEYERSTKHALTRSFIATQEPLPDHPQHPRTAEQIDVRDFHERWTLDHRARTVNDMKLGANKLTNYVLAKRTSAPAVAAPEVKK
eukprot:GILI01012636.1.p1 GENE.GILI01012636.1~~GILI01012636.1.p1  ORF type:complete len:183 (-),score=20.10 GILI01012636.1:158-706(-)